VLVVLLPPSWIIRSSRGDCVFVSQLFSNYGVLCVVCWRVLGVFFFRSLDPAPRLLVLSPAGVSRGAPSGFSPRSCAVCLPPQGTGVGPLFFGCLKCSVWTRLSSAPRVVCFWGGFLCAVWLLCAPRECLLKHLLGSPENVHPEPPSPGDWCGASFSSF